MATDERAARRQAWNQYWGRGMLHSCPGSYAGNYGGALGDFWKQRFQSLEPAMRVLDLGSGNGPLPALMLDTVGAGRLPEIDAVDYATPHPAWLADQPEAAGRVHFHGGVAMEELPFEDARFDRIVSQYGFEYADVERACNEAIRVARPGAGITLVCHHSESRPAAVAAEEAELITWLLDESPLMGAAAALLPWMAMSTTPEGVERLRASPEANTARQVFNDAMGVLVERARAAKFRDVLVDAHDMFQKLMQHTAKQGEAAGAEALADWRSALMDSRLRSGELCEHALDEAGIRALAERFESAGFECEIDELHETNSRGHELLMGWTLDARAA